MGLRRQKTFGNSFVLKNSINILYNTEYCIQNNDLQRKLIRLINVLVVAQDFGF